MTARQAVSAMLGRDCLATILLQLHRYRSSRPISQRLLHRAGEIMLPIERLLEIATQLSSERDLDRLLNLIIEQTNFLLRSDRTSLFLINAEENVLQSKIAQGLREKVIKVPIDRGVTGWTARNKQLLNLEDAQQDERLYSAGCENEGDPYPVRSMLCVPLLDGHQQLHGVIQTMRLHVEPYSSEDETLIRAVASQATVAIHNALLNRQMQEANETLERKVRERTEELQEKNKLLEQIAITDELTGAYNRRYFEQILIQERRLSDRYGSEFSIVMFDIDHFKKVNDTRGHDAGDAVLTQLAGKVRQQLRDCDYLFRYGGEEFVLLLPRTDMSGSLTLAERLRENIAQHLFQHDEETLSDITISLGVATWREKEDKRGAQLLKYADEALYRSKENGRNRVTCAE